MKVTEDFICEHGFPKPWVTCTDCMYLPADERPEPPAPKPPPRAARRGQMPATIDDPLPPLQGDKDVSVAVHSFGEHITGEGNDWLFPEGGGFPWELRAGGWIYLRGGGRLGARARVRGIGFRTVREQHTGEPYDMGPGPTIEVDPATWETVDIDLGELAERQRQGYRYLITARDGSILHLMAGDAILEGFDTDPPSGDR